MQVWESRAWCTKCARIGGRCRYTGRGGLVVPSVPGLEVGIGILGEQGLVCLLVPNAPGWEVGARNAQDMRHQVCQNS